MEEKLTNLKIFEIPLTCESCFNILSTIMNENADSKYFEEEIYKKYSKLLEAWALYVRKLSDVYRALQFAEELGLNLEELKNKGYLDGNAKTTRV